MQKLIKLFWVLLFLGLLACSANTDRVEETAQSQTPTVSQTQIVIYGSNTCDHCIDFRAQLDSAGLAYVFKDVEIHQNLANELRAKIQAINYQGYVSFPVIDVNGKIMVTPKLEEVLVEL